MDDQLPLASSSDEKSVHRSRSHAAGGLLRALYAPIEVLGVGCLVVAAVLQQEWLAVAALGIALFNEIAAVYVLPPFESTLTAVGFRPPIRAMFRSLFVAVMVGVEEGADPSLLELYAACAVGAHALGLLDNAVIGWLLGRAPALGVRNVRSADDLAQVLARVRRHRPLSLYVPLTFEWLGVFGIAIAMHAGNDVLVAAVAAGVAVVLMLGWTFFVLRWAARQLTGSRFARYETRLVEDLTEYAPEAIVYMSAAAGQSGYMLNQWLPAFSTINRRAIIAVREWSNLAPIAETRLPVIYCPQTRDVEQMVLPSVRVAFYVANAGRNVQLLREPAIKHVFLNHGDSDKATSANPVSRVYDEVWVAGQAAIDRYGAAGVRIPRERFAIIGRPQVDRLAVGPLDRSVRRATVLYAPTWEGIYEEVNYSSLEVAGPRLIAQLLDARPDVRIVFKPHPATGEWRAAMREARREVEQMLRESPSEAGHVVVGAQDGITLYECFGLADVLLSDISSVVTDFLYTERPIIVSNPIGLPEDDFRTMFPTQSASYVIGPDFDDLVPVVDVALGEDPFRESRRNVKRYVLGDLPQGPMRAFSAHVDRICEQARLDAAEVRNSFMFSSTHVAGLRQSKRPSMLEALKRVIGGKASSQRG